MRALCLLLLAHACCADINVDLANAQIDPDTGKFCVLQKVCIENPPEALTSAGCAPQYPPGCDCDPLAPNPDDACVSGFLCKNCKCIPEGCDCDPLADDPSSFCELDEICQSDCLCKSPLPPGCDCDSDSPNADEFCPGETRCVGCKCQDCPESSSTSQVFNPPLVFVIDTTKSVKPDKDSIFNLTSKVVNRIKKDKINIPRFLLVSFNDFGPALNLNVRIEADTTDVVEFGERTAGLKFESYNGGRDSKERMTQGLLVALQNASKKSLIVVFTDNGTKDLRLETDINRLRDDKEAEVFIVLTPEYEGRANDSSYRAYNRMGKVFLIKNVGADSFLEKVEEFEEGNCV